MRFSPPSDPPPINSNSNTGSPGIGGFDAAGCDELGVSEALIQSSALPCAAVGTAQAVVPAAAPPMQLPQLRPALPVSLLQQEAAQAIDSHIRLLDQTRNLLQQQLDILASRGQRCAAGAYSPAVAGATPPGPAAATLGRAGHVGVQFSGVTIASAEGGAPQGLSFNVAQPCSPFDLALTTMQFPSTPVASPSSLSSLTGTCHTGGQGAAAPAGYGSVQHCSTAAFFNCSSSSGNPTSDIPQQGVCVPVLAAHIPAGTTACPATAATASSTAGAAATATEGAFGLTLEAQQSLIDLLLMEASLPDPLDADKRMLADQTAAAAPISMPNSTAAQLPAGDVETLSPWSVDTSTCHQPPEHTGHMLSYPTTSLGCMRLSPAQLPGPALRGTAAAPPVAAAAAPLSGQQGTSPRGDGSELPAACTSEAVRMDSMDEFAGGV